MKTSCSLFSCSILLSLGFLATSLAKAEETATWLAGKARIVSGGLMLPDKQGSYDLKMNDASGVAIGEKPLVGSDTKSLEFSGNQVSVLRSEIPFPSVGGALKIELEAMIPEGAGDKDATLLRHGTQWEIRYISKNPSYVFIIWHDINVFTEVRVPMSLGEWNTITAEFTGEDLILKVGSVANTAVAKDVLRQDTGAAPLLVGASTPNITDESLPRLFHGSLANLRITLK